MLNLFPYNNGHMMVAPRRHIKDTSDLRENELLDLFNSLNKVKGLLNVTLHPHGYNIGMNLSEIAGAGIPGHLHIHIVPRWKGDTNFMPVIFHTKVISQSLKELHTLLTNAHAKKNRLS
jgi:ATP adenylyltransferase